LHIPNNGYYMLPIARTPKAIVFRPFNKRKLIFRLKLHKLREY
jgi:hypothetical protein